MKAKCLISNCRFAAAVLLTLSGVLTARAATDYPTTVLSYNPVAYYRLSEAASPPAPDLIINYGSLGAAANGFPTPFGIDDPNSALVRSQSGVIGTSMAFTNPSPVNVNWNSVIDVPYNDAFNPPLGSPFTIEFWANPNTHNNSSGADLLCPVFSVDINQSRSGWLVYQDVANARWNFRIGGVASYAAIVNSTNVTVTPGTWYHVVAVYNGSACSLYVNGVLSAAPVNATSGAGYSANRRTPLRIGGTTFPDPWPGVNSGRTYDGSLQQIAFYGSVLSATTISNHYYLGTNSPGSYSTSVLASSPIGYWHLDESAYTAPNPATLPITVNSGSLGAAANGTNFPGLTAGVAGPPFAGFPASNLGDKTVYAAGNVALGNPAGLNFSGPITMMAWVKPTYTDQIRNIVSHGYLDDGTTQAEVQMRINNGAYEVGSWSPGEGTNSAAGRATTDIGNWVFVAGTYDGTDWRLYRYDQLIAGPSPGPNGALVMAAPWSIGSRGDTSADGRWLGAAVDEVAIFNTALTTLQIQDIFHSAKMSPVILVAPQAPTSTVYEGANLSFSVEAAGNPTLLYQWTKYNTNLPGQTGTTLALNNVVTNDSGPYAIVVTNDYGSITSSFAVTVLQSPPLITQQPQSISRYVGATASFSVAAIGNPPISYAWYYNTNTALGVTATTYSKANVQVADAGKYNCRLSNPYGNSNSAYATLTILSQPSTPYPQAALADNPAAYYRLDESSGTVAHDNWGGHDGTYHSVTLSQPGYSPIDTDTAAKFGSLGGNPAVGAYVGDITGLDFAGTGVPFSLEAWVNGSPNQPGVDTGIGSTIISKGRGGNGGGGVNGLQYVLDVVGGKYRFHVEASSGTPSTGDATAGEGPNGFWQHVVGVLDSGGGMSIYVNGNLSGSGTAPPNGLLSTALKTTIGAGQGGVTPINTAYFTGFIDEAAIYNTALNATQVKAHYCGQFGAGQRPLVLVSPSPVTQWIGWPITLSGVVAGSCDLTYQWYKGTTPLSDSATITGSQSNRLDISSVVLGDAGNYYLSNYNSIGSSNSAVAAVAVLPTPTVAIPVSGLVMHHKFDAGIGLIDSTGRGNDGTGKHTFGPTGGTTTTVNPGPANGGLFEYVVGGQIPNGQTFALKGLHYSSQANRDPQQGDGTTYGTNSYYVNLGTRPDLKFSSNVNFSVSYWVRLPNGYDQGDLPFLCDATNSTGGKGFTFAPSYGSNGVFAAGTEANSGAWAWSVNGVRIEGPWYSINDAFWHNLVHTYDRTGNGVTYLDGVIVDIRSVAAAGDMTQAAPACIGQDPTGSYSENGSADIGDLGVWRRSLSEVEARGIFVAGTNGLSFLDISPTISRGPGANQVTVTWQAGTLQQSSTPSGFLDTAFTSPYTFTPSGQMFFRTRQ